MLWIFSTKISTTIFFALFICCTYTAKTAAQNRSLAGPMPLGFYPSYLATCNPNFRPATQSEFHNYANVNLTNFLAKKPVCNELKRIVSDYKNFYSVNNGLNYGAMLVLGGVFANTSIDQSFQNWYQDDVRSSGTDDFSAFWKTFGEGQYFIPTAITLGFAYRLAAANGVFRESKAFNTTGTFFSRMGRGYIVGLPPLLVFQRVLGAGRPAGENSNWRPFENANAVSGHAFIGAVPFITAAQMSKDWKLKTLFYTCSTFTAWSRVNDDAHYLSQVILGWHLAYLSARAVSKTDGVRLPKGMTIFPITEPRTIGIGLHYQR